MAGYEHSSLGVRVLLIIIRVYQIFISPIFGARCRFEPSCSRYAGDAISKFGVGRGSAMAIKRVCCCHPLHPGGYDPVP